MPFGKLIDIACIFECADAILVESPFRGKHENREVSCRKLSEAVASLHFRKLHWTLLMYDA